MSTLCRKLKDGQCYGKSTAQEGSSGGESQVVGGDSSGWCSARGVKFEQSFGDSSLVPLAPASPSFQVFLVY